MLEISLRGDLYRFEVVGFFLCQHNLLVDRNAAELTEQHLRKGQSVAHLEHGHLGLVHLHADTQAVRTGGYAFLDHLLDIAIQLLHQVEIALCQLLLMAQGNHLPIGLVDMIKGGLALGLSRIGS